MDEAELERLIDAAPSHLNLFRLPRQHKPAYWVFIMLIARDDVANPTISAHARGAWCLKCSKEIYYVSGNSGARDHMRYEHRDDLLRFQAIDKEKKAAEKKRKVSQADLDLKPAEPALKRVKIADADQTKFDQLVALWVASSMRPICIVEDPGLRSCMKFLGKVFGADFKMPKRGEIRTVISV